jgi:gliding motility-associatede transport system auxiliary component
MNSKKFFFPLLLLIGILIVANLVSRELFFRIDLTEDKQYTLSDATKDILADLPDPVTVKAYFSEGLPPNVGKVQSDFKDLLIEYSNVSHGMIVYEFIDPNKDEETEQQAMSAGIRPVVINVREKDQMKQQKAYLGASISLGEGTEVIPFMEPGAGMEYALTTSIKKLSVVEKPKVGFITGHGEPPLNELSQLRTELEVLYAVQPVDLENFNPTNSGFKTLVFLRPTDTISPLHLEKLSQYLQGGGNLVVGINRVKADLQQGFGSQSFTGLGFWLESYGILVTPTFLTDANCGSVAVQQQQGFFTYSTNVSFPYLPIISNFKDHPIANGLETVLLQFPSPLSYVGDSSSNWRVIAESSGKSGISAAPLVFDIQKQWTDADFVMGPQAVAGVLEGRSDGGMPFRIAVIGDGDFCVNGARGQQVQGDNISFMANSIDFLSDDTGLINLRTRGISSRPIKELEDGTKTLLKYLNFGLPLLLVVIYGGIRAQRRRTRRMNRLEENYG